jgi:imidazolonepropionase-like amidohydrolase
MIGLLLIVLAQDWSDKDVETDADRKPKLQTGGSILLKNATILTLGPAGTMEKASILIEHGKIKAIGATIESNGTTVDATGLFVMPGIVDCHSHIAVEGGLNEMAQSLSCEVRIGDVLVPTDVMVYRAAAGGVTTSNILHGSANAIGGQNAVIKHRYGKPLLFEGAPRGVKFALGENPKQSNFSQNRGKRYPNTRLGVEATIREAFNEARQYQKEWDEYNAKVAAGQKLEPPRRDLRLDTLVGVIKGEVLVHCHCYRADEILMLLQVAKDYGFRVQTFQHVLEGYKVAREIAEAGSGASTFSDWWGFKIEAFDAIPYNAAILHRAGVCVSLNSDSGELTRHLYMEAAKAVKYGGVLPDDALRMITLFPARQLGIDSRVGSLEVGKDGDVAVFNGHPLSPYSRCVMTVVDGEVVFDKRDVPHHATANFDPARRARSTAMTPGPRGDYAITNATIVPVGAPTIERGTIVIQNGKITAMGADAKIPPTSEIIDGTGKFVYPGLIDLGTGVGLTEIGSVAGTNDASEIGTFNPECRALTAVNPDSELVPVTRANGVTMVQVVPRGGLVCGESAVIRLAGWVPGEMAARAQAALHVNFPPVKKIERSESWEEHRRDEPGPKPEEDTRLKDLRTFFEAARRYAAAHEKMDLKLEAMAPYLRRERPVMFHASDADDIRAAVLFAEKMGVTPVIYGGREAWKVAGFLKDKRVPVLVGPVATLPAGKSDPVDSGYFTAARLHAAGVRFAIISDDSHNVRNLPYHAALAAAHGLPREEALKAITLYPAQILGLEGGALEVGKPADVIVTTGDPLEIITDVAAVFIGGKPVPLENRQTRLAEKYLQRLK